MWGVRQSLAADLSIDVDSTLRIAEQHPEVFIDIH